MDKVTGTLTVYFEDPFWVGVFERTERGKLSACKVTFGAEPKEHQVYAFVLKDYNQLVFSPAVESDRKKASANPKRRQREAGRQMRDTGIGTKSQQALQLQREQMKIQRKKQSREEKQAEKQRRFDLKQQKRKEKHKGH